MKGGLGGNLPVSQMDDRESWCVLMLNVESSLLKKQPRQSRFTFSSTPLLAV